jgi:hypothetical protein
MSIFSEGKFKKMRILIKTVQFIDKLKLAAKLWSTGGVEIEERQSLNDLTDYPEDSETGKLIDRKKKTKMMFKKQIEKFERFLDIIDRIFPVIDPNSWGLRIF